MSAVSDSINPYRILDPLGRGGMGVVCRAEHLETRRPVALKSVRVADEQRIESVRREIRGLARLRHTSVVGIVDEASRTGCRGRRWSSSKVRRCVNSAWACTATSSPQARSRSAAHDRPGGPGR